MRSEEPWPTLSELWAKIFAYRDQLYLERDELNMGDPTLPILQAKLDATRDIQQMLFEMLRTEQRKIKDVNPS